MITGMVSIFKTNTSKNVHNCQLLPNIRKFYYSTYYSIKTRNKAKTEVLDQTEILSDAQNIPFCNKVDNTI